MRVVIQRVAKAKVEVDHKTIAQIDHGIMLLLGIEIDETDLDIKWLSAKIANLRIFNDVNGVMNLNIKEVDGNAIVVSQFTLHASIKKGNRPSYIKAARPEIAIPIYEKFIKQLESDLEKPVEKGVFGAHMMLDFINDGPVTIIIDTKIKE